jgi:ASC-1-like (ASCH) protein
MSLSALLETYGQEISKKSSGNIELELRFAIPSKDEYASLLKNILAKKDTASMLWSIDFLKFTKNTRVQGSSSNESWIASMHYAEQVKNGIASVEKLGELRFSGKQRVALTNVNDDFAPYKVVISKETPREKYDVNSFSIMRVKNRVSIFVKALPDWRFDFTLTALPTTARVLPEIRKTMFPIGLTIDNFLQKAPLIQSDKLEFEVEYIGDKEIMSADIYKVIDFIRESGQINYTNNVRYQMTLFEIAKLVYPESKAENFKRKDGLKAFGPAPKGLDKKVYFDTVLSNITDYVVGEKADGVNVVGYIIGTAWHTLGGELETKELDGKYDQPTIYQAEMVDGIHYIHDVIMYNGEKLTSMPTTKRMASISNVVKMLPAGASINKQFTPLTADYAKEMKAVYEADYPYELDGLIFTHKNKDWYSAEIYKWKPPEELKIDMLVMEPPTTGVIGIAPHIPIPGHRLLFLFCGISKQQSRRTHHIRRVEGYGKMFSGRVFYDYWPIQFAPVGDSTVYIYHHPIDDKRDIIGHISEFARDGDRWKLTRIRSDRDIEIARGSYFGNNIAVAESIWNNIKSPLTFDILRSSMLDIDSNANVYFSKTDPRYKPANNFSSYVKEETLKAIDTKEWVIDLAAGRGADLGRWSRLGIKNALCIDNDIDALKELRNRQQSAQRAVGHYKTVVYTHHANLTDDYTDLQATIKNKYPLPPDGVMLAVCNMAIHYFCESDVTVSNFVMLVDSMVAKNGKFIFTCYNGRRVFDALKGNDRYQLFDNGALKYAIIRSFLGTAFRPYGLKIQTLLGFADGKMRDEYLVDIDYIIKLFRARGFKLVMKKSFGEHLEGYSVDNLDQYDKMTDADMDHVSLYDYVVLQKIKAVGGGPSDRTAGENNSYVISTTPLVVIPTRQTMAKLNIVNVTMDKRGESQSIVTLNTKAIEKLKIGDRVSINGEFDGVVNELSPFPTYKSVFMEFEPDAIGLDGSVDDVVRAFRRRYTYARETRRGVIVIKISKL